MCSFRFSLSLFKPVIVSISSLFLLLDLLPAGQVHSCDTTFKSPSSSLLLYIRTSVTFRVFPCLFFYSKTTHRLMNVEDRHVILASLAFDRRCQSANAAYATRSKSRRPASRLVKRTNDEFMAARYSSMNQRSASDLYGCAKVNSYAQPCPSETL